MVYINVVSLYITISRVHAAQKQATCVFHAQVWGGWGGGLWDVGSFSPRMESDKASGLLLDVNFVKVPSSIACLSPFVTLVPPFVQTPLVLPRAWSR